MVMLGADDASASSSAVPTTMPTNDPMFTIIVGQGDGDGVDGGTVFQLPASTFAAFPDTLLHDRTHRILQFRDPYLIQLPDCSPVVFRRVVLPFYDTAERYWNVPVHLPFPKNVLLPAGTFLGRLVEAVDVGEPSGNADGEDDDDGEAGELSPHRINHDLQFLGIPSPFDPRWSLSVFAWTSTGRAALRRIEPALEQIERAQKEAAEATKSWVSTIKEFNAIWPKLAVQTAEEDHSEPRDREEQSPEPSDQEESSDSEPPQQAAESDSAEQMLSDLTDEDDLEPSDQLDQIEFSDEDDLEPSDQRHQIEFSDEVDSEPSDQGDQIEVSSTSSDASSTPKPVALIASAELQKALNSFFRVGEMAEAAEELMKKWEHVREWEIPEFQFEPQACLVSDFVIENEAWSKTRTVLDKLFGLQNVYFRRMDLADGGGNHSRGCYYYDPARENYLSTGNLKLTNAFPRKAAPGDVAERGSIVFGDVSTLPQHDASTAVYHPAALQRVPQQVFNFDFGVESAKRLQFVRWPCRLDVCHENSGICAFYQEFLSTICVVIYPLMG